MKVSIIDLSFFVFNLITRQSFLLPFKFFIRGLLHAYLYVEGGVVAQKILVTSPKSRALGLIFLGFWAGLHLDFGLGLVN